jgi:hypothetical protein
MCSKITKPGFPYKLLSLSSGDIGIKNSRGQAVCSGQIELAFWPFFYLKRTKRPKYSLQRAVASDATSSNFLKNAPNGHYNLQRTVVPV